MDGITVFTGAESVKEVVVGFNQELVETKAIPYVGTDRKGEFVQLGVGIMFPELNRVCHWGLVMPHLLLQSWRGMKFLEETKMVNPSNTLAACWYAGGSRKLEKSYVEHLSDAGISYFRLQIMRALVLNQKPDQDVLIEAATKLAEAGVQIDDEETWLS